MCIIIQYLVNDAIAPVNVLVRGNQNLKSTDPPGWISKCFSYSDPKTEQNENDLNYKRYM